jgi:hypothetical protein
MSASGQKSTSARSCPTSAMGQSRRFDRIPTTSARPLQTDIVAVRRHVSKVPIPAVVEWCCSFAACHVFGYVAFSRKSLLPTSEEQDGSRPGGPQE